MSAFPLRASAASGTGLTLVGVIDHDKILSVAGLLISLASLVATFLMGQYHEWRERRRKEDAADEAQESKQRSDRIEQQLQLETKAKANADRIEGLAVRLGELEARSCLNAPTCPRRIK